MQRLAAHFRRGAQRWGRAGCGAAAAGGALLYVAQQSPASCEPKATLKLSARHEDTTTRFRLVATDLDGTLFNSESKVSEANLQALRSVIGPECPLVLATARSIMECIPHEAMPGPLYIICNGGAHGLRRVDEGGSSRLEDLFMSCLSEAQARAAVDIVEAEGGTIWVAQADKIFVKPGVLGVAESEEHLKMFESPSCVQRVCDLEEALAANRTIEVCALLPDADIAAVRMIAALEEAGASQGMDIMTFPAEPLVSIRASGVDKATALTRICQHLGVDAKSVVAFGDGSNDVPMLRFAGLGVAMANAGNKARAAANAISPWSNQEDAVGRELLQLRVKGRI